MSALPSLQDLRQKPDSELFPSARSPRGARAGLLLFHGEWDEAHTVAQDLETPDGSFWHGIIHRLEPDPANAAYWFRRAGRHPAFPALREAVREIEARYLDIRLGIGRDWDPFRWIDFWESARGDRDSRQWHLAEEIDREEWRILYHHCRTRVE